MKFKKIILLLIILIFGLNFSICQANSDNLNITAGAAILMDSSTGKVLYSKNEKEKMFPASTTKIMTAILTIENCNLEDVVTVPYEAIASVPSGYSIASLQAGEQLTVNQLLEVMMVHSANDAANVLAYHVSGSIDSFSTMMNNKVSELELENTHFTNPSGKHDENHYTTASDLAKIMQYCMKNSAFRKIAGLKSCIIPPTNKYDQRVFSPTNELLVVDNSEVSSNYYYKYAIAGKTGYTTEAKNCLVSVSNKDNLELISVVLSIGLYPNNLSGKFIETKSLFQYGYENYTIRKLREKDAIITQTEIKNGTKETKNLDLLLSNDITVLINQSELNTDFSPEININNNLSAPISRGQVVGSITYNIDDITYSCDLIASHNVEKSSFFTLMFQSFLIILILFFLYKLLFGDKFKKKNLKRKKYCKYLYK